LFDVENFISSNGIDLNITMTGQYMLSYEYVTN